MPGPLEAGQPGGGTPGAPARQPNALDDILIEELELGVRSYNCLKRAGIQTVGDLVSKTESELNAIPNFGKKSIDEVVETLHARGLSLRDDSNVCGCACDTSASDISSAGAPRTARRC